ncbi:hypothetical protein FHL15_001055 [Xylaria flabelliformis]|uniref:Uncharacterized protein n=1 Tax=Xylaria flabelliformis TaxID=2512241 RepID=A0A553ICB8_9PEZI|nr:hypothetical protein FHL15_001055 [Xylaria flabelliformis]
MESTGVKPNTSGNSSDAQKPKSNSQTNPTGLVAVVVVLALLLLGSAAAYLLMRRYLAKGQRNRAATTAVNDTGEDGEVRGLRRPEIPTMTTTTTTTPLEKGIQTQGSARES